MSSQWSLCCLAQAQTQTFKLVYSSYFICMGTPKILIHSKSAHSNFKTNKSVPLYYFIFVCEQTGLFMPNQYNFDLWFKTLFEFFSSNSEKNLRNDILCAPKYIFCAFEHFWKINEPKLNTSRKPKIKKVPKV